MVSKGMFDVLIDETFKEIQMLTKTKGEEYSRSEDQLANFKREAEKNEISKEKVLSIYLSKHMDSIQFYINKKLEPSEPIEGRINDAILYLIILKAMVYEDRYTSDESHVEGPRYAFVIGENE